MSWADDVKQLAQHLQLARFAVLGYSSGGPNALVCAAELRENVAALGLVSTDGYVRSFRAPSQGTEGGRRKSAVLRALAAGTRMRRASGQAHTMKNPALTRPPCMPVHSR